MDEQEQKKETPEDKAAENVSVEPLSEDIDSKAKIFKAGEVFRSLERTLKIRRLYSPTNQAYKTAIDHLAERLGQYLQEFDILSVRVTAKGIKLGRDIPIYENDDKESSVSFQLYKDGIRRISFSLGLDREEMVRFIGVLELDREGRTAFDDDLVTLLWKGNFENISYRVVDPVLDEEVEDELDDGTTVGGLAGRGGDAIKSLRGEVKEFVRKVSSSLIDRADLGKDSIGGGEDRGYQDDVPIASEERIQSNLPVIARLDSQEIERLKKEVSSNKNVGTLDKFVDILLLLLSKEGDSLENNEAGQIVWALMTGYFNGGYFATLNVLIERLKSLDGKVSPGLWEEVKSKIEALGEEALLSKLPDIFSRGYQGGTESLGTFLKNLGPNSTKPLQSLLARLKGDSKHRQLVLEALIAGEDREISEIARGLLDVDQDIALATISVLKARKDRASIHYLPSAMKHADSMVRIGAIDALRRFSDPRATVAMLRGLEDYDGQVRLFTLNALKGRKDPRVSTRVSQVIDSKGFMERSIWEQQHYFELLIENRGPVAFGILKEKLTKKKLFGGKNRERVRIAAAKALAELPLPSTVELLKHVKEKESGDLARACEESLMELAKPRGGTGDNGE
ncbi:MAG: HEAT repeat domain-containing protein [Deltaproteobacteria bacterium]|nr:HEAT repeat domain-containing protein [Deltaproteobacteria bacterium]